MALVYIVILGFFGWLMISRRMTATLALPIGSFCLALVALFADPSCQGVLAILSDLFSKVIEPGITRLSNPIFAVILGAILAGQMQATGAAERIVRYTAEYAGEDRFKLGLLLLLVISILFTTLVGLGGVILVASIALPLMFSLGFEPKVAGGLFLLGLSLGGCMNPVNWALYIGLLKLDQSQIIPFAMSIAAAFFIVTCLYLLAYVSGRAEWKKQIPFLALILAVSCAIAVIIFRLPSVWAVIKHIAAALLLGLLVILVLLMIIRLLLVLFHQGESGSGWLGMPGNWLTSASILIPLLLLLWSSLHESIVGKEAAVLSIPILSAMTAGIVFCALSSYTRDGSAANRMMRSLFDGVTQTGPAVIMMIGIGLLLKATTLENVVQSFQPLLERLPVGTPVLFVLVFFILSPLALYRGPLNLWGMGSGVVGIVKESMILASPLIMSAFFSVGMLQGVCDPTNTHNVWIANFCKVPVNELTRITFAWVLIIVLLGLVIGSMMFGSLFGQPVPATGTL